MPTLAKTLFNKTSACEQASRWVQPQMFSPGAGLPYETDGDARRLA